MRSSLRKIPFTNLFFSLPFKIMSFQLGPPNTYCIHSILKEVNSISIFSLKNCPWKVSGFSKTPSWLLSSDCPVDTRFPVICILEGTYSRVYHSVSSSSTWRQMFSSTLYRGPQVKVKSLLYSELWHGTQLPLRSECARGASSVKDRKAKLRDRRAWPSWRAAAPRAAVCIHHARPRAPRIAAPLDWAVVAWFWGSI